MVMVITTEWTKFIYSFCCWLWLAVFLCSTQSCLQMWTLCVEVWNLNQECVRYYHGDLFVLFKAPELMQSHLWYIGLSAPAISHITVAKSQTWSQELFSQKQAIFCFISTTESMCACVFTKCDCKFKLTAFTTSSFKQFVKLCSA